MVNEVAEVYALHWQNETVGQIKILTTDMWYWDCVFTPTTSLKANDFMSLVNRLVVKEVFTDWKKGILVTIHLEQIEQKVTTAVVLGFNENVLLLRAYLKEETVQLLS